MAIRGSLTEASLPDVLQLLAMGKKTGCLGLTHASHFGYIYFRNGTIVHASIVNQTLGVEDTVYVLFTWAHGTFNFEPGVAPDETLTLVELDSQTLLLEGARRVDEWGLITKKIPSFDIVYAVDRQKLLMAEIELTLEQEAIIPFVDGQRDVRALISDSGLAEFDVGKALYGLVTTSFVVRVGLSQSRQLRPADDRVNEHRKLGVAFYKTGMYEEAARELRRVETLCENDATASFYLGLVALRYQQWDAAVRAFERHAAHSAPRAAVFVNLSYAYERLGELDKARTALQSALSYGGRNDPVVHTNVAILAIAVGEHDQADAALGTARTLWATRRPPPVWYHYAGFSAALTNDLDRAIAIWTEAVGVYPSYAMLWNNLAVAYESRANYDDAIKTLECGLVENSTLPQLHRNFADCLRHNGHFDEAREAYRRAQNLTATGS